MLNFGDSCYALHTAMRIPLSLNWTFLNLESDQDVVEPGRRIATAIDCGRQDRKVLVASHPPKVLVRNRDNLTDLTYNARVDYSIFGITHTV